MDKTASLRVGFTLIELLIVIALLGALAIGLLATIDPFEQLKKGRDTSIRNTTAELYNANLRYYATRSEFPWDTDPANYNGITNNGSELAGPGGVIERLADAGELKERFIELAGYRNLQRIIVSSSARDQVAVCFQPESKSFRNDPVVIFDSVGSERNDCVAIPGQSATDCWLCLQ